MQTDPVAGTTALPQSLNRYAYITNNPINAIDLLGLFPTVIPPICPVVGGVAICGSLGGISVNAGLSGVPNAAGGGSASDQLLLVDSPLSESDEIEDGQKLSEILAPIPSGKDEKKVTDGVADALKMTEKTECDQALKEHGIASLNALVKSLKLGKVDDQTTTASGNIFDGRTSQAPVSYVIDGKDVQTAVSEYFKKKGDIAITWDHSIVYLGPKFFKQGEKERAITLIHEAAHLGGVSDTDFDPDQDTGSRKITELLKAKCK